MGGAEQKEKCLAKLGQGSDRHQELDLFMRTFSCGRDVNATVNVSSLILASSGQALPLTASKDAA